MHFPKTRIISLSITCSVMFSQSTVWCVSQNTVKLSGHWLFSEWQGMFSPDYTSTMSMLLLRPRVSIDVMEHHDQSIGDKRDYFSSQLSWLSTPSLREVMAKIQVGQESGEENWKRGYGATLFTGLPLIASSILYHPEPLAQGWH